MSEKSEKVITIRQLAREMSRDTDCTERQAAVVIGWLLDSMQHHLANGDSVMLSGFGHFRIDNRLSRGTIKGRQFESRRNRVLFRAANKLKREVNR